MEERETGKETREVRKKTREKGKYYSSWTEKAEKRKVTAQNRQAWAENHRPRNRR